MRVLYIISNLENGGAQKLIVDIIILLRKLNCNCDVFVLKRSENNIYHNQLLAAGVNVFYSKVNKYFSYKNIIEIKKIRKQYNLIHTHLFHAQYFTAIEKILFRHRIPLVTTEHSTTNRRRSNSFFRWIEKIIYGKYEMCIAISQGTKESLVNWVGPNVISIPVIYNGVDLTNYSVNKEGIKEQTNEVVLCMVSRLVASKNHEVIIDALEFLPSNYIVNLVGDGVNRSKLEEYVSQKLLSDRVNFLGYRDDVADILRSTDIYIQASNWEGFGLSVVEAMALGLPVIASNIIGLKEIVDGVGMTFENNQPHKLAEMILKLGTNKELLEDMKAKSVKKSKEFNIERTAIEYYKLYKEII